ncbi:MAG: cyclic pyranopterin monophosphate synthase MoaC [Thermincolia bacterium]
MSLTHFDDSGRARMVDVSDKEDTTREAIAQAEIRMKGETLQLIKEGRLAKGDVLGVAQVGGIMGVKQTSNLIPMCHPLLITGTNLDFRLVEENNRVLIEARVRTTGKTGVEMEALTGVTVAALTIYDMCKAVDKDMVICDIRLIEKTGGKSGLYQREGEKKW